MTTNDTLIWLLSLPPADAREAAPPPSEQVERIIEKLLGIGINSTNRLDETLRLISGRTPEVFWPVLTEVWSNCDDTWDWKHNTPRLNARNGRVSLHSTDAVAGAHLPRLLTFAS